MCIPEVAEFIGIWVPENNFVYMTMYDVSIQICLSINFDLYFLFVDKC